MYSYEREKARMHTDDGQRLFLAIRDQVKRKVAVSGAVTMGHAIELPPGLGAADSWAMMACVDRLVELNELKYVYKEGAGQDWVLVPVRQR